MAGKTKIEVILPTSKSSDEGNQFLRGRERGFEGWRGEGGANQLGDPSRKGLLEEELAELGAQKYLQPTLHSFDE